MGSTSRWSSFQATCRLRRPGTLTIETSADLSSSAVEIAALINQESGAIVNRYVSSVPDDGPITFSIGYDPDLLKPDGTYVVKAAIVDGENVYEGREGAVAIDAGTPLPEVDVPLEEAPDDILIPPTEPSKSPSESASESPRRVAEREPGALGQPGAHRPARSPRPRRSPPRADARADPEPTPERRRRQSRRRSPPRSRPLSQPPARRPRLRLRRAPPKSAVPQCIARHRARRRLPVS